MHKKMEELFFLNSRGLIAGPEESENAFYKRCRASKPQSTLSKTLASKLFDIDPDWISIVFSSKKLRFWEGGCTFIEGDKITLQLPKSLEKKNVYFKLYSKEEIVAHELVHVARAAFEEPIFEEILAYQTSSFWFRRFFGPLFRSSKEMGIFSICTLLIFSFFLFSSFTLFCTLTFAILLGIPLFRLMRAQHIFSKTKKKLSKMVTPEKALFIMLRLTDREIIRFSKMSEKEILAYAEKMKKGHLRWQQIFSYL